jgi:hypothetical protein
VTGWLICVTAGAGVAAESEEEPPQATSAVAASAVTTARIERNVMFPGLYS